MLILVLIPVPDRVDPLFSLDSLPQLLEYTKKHIRGVEFHIKSQTGVRTDRNRNSMLYKAINEGINFDYILHLDADQIYPKDMIVKYLENPQDIVGCMYYNRGYPHNPNVYLSGGIKTKPYRPVDPRKLPENQLFEVDGLGFGGMMVSRKVIDGLGDKKWTHYGHNFFYPMEMEDQLSHDLQFCKDSKEAGFRIFVHTGVQSDHIGVLMVNRDIWQRSYDEEKKEEKKEPKITVIMPSIDMPKANAAALQLIEMAGMSCVVLPIEDVSRIGFIAMANKLVRENPSDYYVYTAQDAYGGKDWLKIAHEKLESTGKGLLAFNDSKWFGKLAAFGMVRHDWMVKNYDGDLFYSSYHSHYADTELTELARTQDELVYDPESLLIEVDSNKHGVCESDRQLFKIRMKELGINTIYG